MEANVHCFPAKEWISDRTNANTFTEAIVQPPELVEHLVPVKIGRDIGLRDIRHVLFVTNAKPTTVNCFAIESRLSQSGTFKLHWKH